MSVPWKRDAGLTARMAISFIILGLLYVVFLSVLYYLGVGYIPLAVIAAGMIMAQWYFSDKIGTLELRRQDCIKRGISKAA